MTLHNGNRHQFKRNNYNTAANGSWKAPVSSPKSAKVLEVFDNKLKLFIKNIPNDGDAVKSQIQQLINPCGEIILERYFTRRRGSKSIHTALIVLKTEASVKKSLEVHGSVVEGRHIIVSSYAQYTANKNSVVLKNLSWDVTEEDLWKLFESKGKILFINIINPVNINASNQPLEGEVIFETEEEVEKALALDKTELHGRPLSVLRICREKEDHADFAVYVSGLPQGVTKEKVIEFFDKCGVVRMVKINFKTLSAVLHFTSKEAVNAALKLDGRSLDNYRLAVRQREGEILNMDLENPVYLYNIAESVKDSDIFFAFQDCGYIIEVRFLQRKSSNAMKKAVIQFKYPDSILKAIALDGLELGGSPVSVSDSEKCSSIVAGINQQRATETKAKGSVNSKFKNKNLKQKRPLKASRQVQEGLMASFSEESSSPKKSKKENKQQ